jgi:hypothetical protein
MSENHPPNRPDVGREERLIKEAITEIRHEEAELKHAEEVLEKVEHQLERSHQFVTIIVDGTPHEVPKRERITYVEVVTLAHPDYPQHPEITYSVTFTKGPSEKPEGILSPGGSIKVKEGMSFVVDRTGQS